MFIETTLGHRFVLVGREDNTEAGTTSVVRVQSFRFDPEGKNGVPAFYTHRIDSHGYPIVASAKGSPYALKEAAYLVDISSHTISTCAAWSTSIRLLIGA